MRFFLLLSLALCALFAVARADDAGLDKVRRKILVFC